LGVWDNQIPAAIAVGSTLISHALRTGSDPDGIVSPKTLSVARDIDAVARYQNQIVAKQSAVQVFFQDSAIVC
jgi:hypothetical protein